MKIKPPCIAALSWVMHDTLGEELDVLAQPLEFLIGGQDLLKVIEDALEACSSGDTIKLQIEPEQGFGDYNEQLLFLEPRALFDASIAAGMIFDGKALPAGCSPQAPKDLFYTITDVYPEHVVLDGNHPLAGIALRLTIKVHGVRPATQAEINQGSAGAGFFHITPLPPANTSGQRH